MFFVPQWWQYPTMRQGIGSEGPLGPIHHVGGLLPRDFWFSDSRLVLNPPFTGETTANGFTFRGRLSYNSGSLLKTGFGVVARYVLSPDRIPRPERGPWRSVPRLDLFGLISGGTTAPDIFAGDKWSKCSLIKRQTIFQHVFSPPGTDNRRIIGHNVESEQLIFIEGAGKDQHKQLLPGFKPMPPVVIDQIFPGIPIWAELEVRFDIQVVGDSTLWIDNDIVVRLDQWPLEPIG
ncbi:hypothetical protein LIT25_22780 [Bacillus sp. F19]|nr:hypothetical protein LIT25_22780 [Bacillus sp. F19]